MSTPKLQADDDDDDSDDDDADFDDDDVGDAVFALCAIYNQIELS